jgi:hypothetical protein
MNEVFYVTSTCMLVRHEVFRQLRGWDARMEAFAEDLDLCWRARVMGHVVRIEPRAKARHATALAEGNRPSPFLPGRYYSRRNRLRAVAKNTSGLRLLLTIPQFILLALAEMVGFIVLRQPREILNLSKALGWNITRIPQTISERARVQRKRVTPDAKLARLTVSQAKRMRFYISNKRDRLEETWGRRAELLSRRTAQARVVGGRFRGWLGFAVVLLVVGILLGFRSVWWGDQLAVGELLPFPDRATGLWRAFASPWRSVGLGQPAPNSPSLVLLGIFPVLALGAAGAAQKLMLLTLGIVAFVGAYKLVSDLVDRWGRLAAGAVYAFGAVGYAGIRSGSLGSLVFGAAAPFVLLAMVRIAGWARPPGYVAARTVARAALGAAVSAAFVPGSLILFACAGILLTTARAAFMRGEKVARGALLSLGSLLLAWALLLPWSAGWFSVGGPLAVLRGDRWRYFAESFSGHGMASAVLGQTPEGPVLFGVALVVLGAIAVVVGEGQRRRLALALWLVIVVMGLFMSLFSAGTIRPFVASPVEAGVLVQACFAGLVGLAVGAFRLDLPRRGLGLIHGATLFAMAASALLLVAGLAPALWHGDWAPGRDGGRATAEVVAQVGSLFQAEAQAVGPFRALWVGEGWAPPMPLVSRPVGDEFLTGARGHVMTDLFERSSGAPDEQLRRVIDSIETGSTDGAGELLGAFNIHFVVLERSADPGPWLLQRDLALVRTEPEFLIFRNDMPLERAALYPELPSAVTAIAELDPTLAAAERQPAIEALRQRRPGSFSAAKISTPGTVFLAEAADNGWRAELDGVELERVDAGWGNAFEVSAGSGRMQISYDRSLGMVLWIVVLFFAWIVVIGASFSRRKTAVPVPRVPRRPRRKEPERFEPPVMRGGGKG